VTTAIRVKLGSNETQLVTRFLRLFERYVEAVEEQNNSLNGSVKHEES